MPIRIEAYQGGYVVGCSFCGKSQYVDGRFVPGLELPRSVEKVLRAHHGTSVVFPGNACEKRDVWAADSWVVIEGAGERTTNWGAFTLTDDGPVVDPEIEGDDMGRTWNRRRVKTLAKRVIDASEFRQREWHVNNGDHPNVVLKTRTGQAAIIPISREELDVERLTDQEIEDRVYAHLSRLRISEAEGSA